MYLSPFSARSISLPENKTVYPQPFAVLVEGRSKRKLSDYFGLTNCDINLSELAPRAISALFHSHSKLDEFVYILENAPTIILDKETYLPIPGDRIGCKADSGIAHRLINHSKPTVTYMEAGDRTSDYVVGYPNNALKTAMLANGQRSLSHRPDCTEP